MPKTPFVNTYVPFPVGTVRGPYYTQRPFKVWVDFMVQGPGGWIPFSGEVKDQKKISEDAHLYAERFGLVEVPLGHS